MSSEGSSASQYTTQALDHLNSFYKALLNGGNEFDVDFAEPWVWARSRRPFVLELKAPVSVTATMTLGDEDITFSAGPSISLAGYWLIPQGSSYPDVYRIASHTAAATAAELDGPYAGATGTVTFKAVKLEYELTPSYVVIDNYNNRLDIIANSSSNTVLTATLTNGAYTPAELATHVATRLGVADTNSTYSGSYDSDQRFFSLTSTLVGANAVFRPITAGTNFYRSGWSDLGFDYANVATAATQTGTYVLGGVTRLCAPGRIYYGSQGGHIDQLDPSAFDRDYSMSNLSQGTPKHFCVREDKGDGRLSVQVSHYPDRAMRVEFDFIPVQKKLQNNAYSVPKLPQRILDLLEYGAAYFLCIDKNDMEKANTFFTLTQRKLRAAVKDNRKQLMQTGSRFGQYSARNEQVASVSRTDKYGYDVGV